MHRHDSENAISANLTHMADACHMQLVICQARRARHQQPDDDSRQLRHITRRDGRPVCSIVREQFVNLYTHYDPFQKSSGSQPWVNEGVPTHPIAGQGWQSTSDQVGEVRTKRNPDYIDLPPLPERGDLDLEAIADSIYSFL